jgi:hypothetical protein
MFLIQILGMLKRISNVQLAYCAFAGASAEQGRAGREKVASKVSQVLTITAAI